LSTETVTGTRPAEARLARHTETFQILNSLRSDRGLPNARRAVSRNEIRQITVEVWKKYPQALKDPAYELGPLTLALVEQEIWQRIEDLSRGVEVKTGRIPDYHF
jgi:hypothetical protein